MINMATTLLVGLLATGQVTPQPPPEADFLAQYHRKPVPERVPEMLAILIDQKGINSEHNSETSLKTLGFGFGLIARGNPKLVRLYETKFPTATLAGRQFLLESLRVCGDKETLARVKAWAKDPGQREMHQKLEAAREFLEDPNRRLPRELAARTAIDLDLLWMDFCVTGEYAPVARILDVLDEPDLLRQKIDARAGNDPQKRQELLASVGLLEAEPPQTIGGITMIKPRLPTGDLDLRLATSHEEIEPEALAKLRQMVSPEDLTPSAMKGAANWSARSNLLQYPRLAEVLKEHKDQRPAKSRALIAEWLREREELLKLQGTWRTVAMERMGTRAPQEALPTSLCIIRGSEMVFKEKDKESKVSFRIDPERTPKWFDMAVVLRSKPSKGNQELQTKKYLPGIYTLEGRRLTLCLNEYFYKARPSEFHTKESVPWLLLVLEREKR
jgi:uncharacterized protein (TIGR03067 family)